MKKDYYYITKGYITKGRQNSYGVELVHGFVDDSKQYGYRYVREPKKSRWECTDLKSGLLVIAKKTIDDCVKHTIDYEQDINRARKTKPYEKIVVIFNQLIREQQMKDDAEFNAGW